VVCLAIIFAPLFSNHVHNAITGAKMPDALWSHPKAHTFLNFGGSPADFRIM